MPMKIKRIVCMLMITMLVSSCKIAHEIALSEKPATDEITLTEPNPTENGGLPQEIAGHKVTYTDVNKTEVNSTDPATVELKPNKSTNWLLIALIALPLLFILLYVINKRIAKKMNEIE